MTMPINSILRGVYRLQVSCGCSAGSISLRKRHLERVKSSSCQPRKQATIEVCTIRSEVCVVWSSGWHVCSALPRRMGLTAPRCMVPMPPVTVSVRHSGRRLPVSRWSEYGLILNSHQTQAAPGDQGKQSPITPWSRRNKPAGGADQHGVVWWWWWWWW